MANRKTRKRKTVPQRTKTQGHKRSTNVNEVRKSKRNTVSVHDTDTSSDDDQQSMASSDSEIDNDHLDAATSLMTIKSTEKNTEDNRINVIAEVVQRLEQKMGVVQRLEQKMGVVQRLEQRMDQIEAKMVPNEIGPRSVGVSSMTTPSTTNLSVPQLKMCKSLVKQTLNDSIFSIKKFLTTKEANDIIEGTETLKKFPITVRMVLENINSIRQSSQISARKGYMSKSMHEHINGGTKMN